ncbi:hypothetical protein ACFE04_003645 [Oxalis oulophora]
MAFMLSVPTNQNVPQVVSLLEIKQMHAHMLKTCIFNEVIPVSKLLSLCTSKNSGNLTYAQTIFDRTPNPNTLMWNSMIRGYANSNEPEKAFFLYQEFLCKGVRHNAYTFPFLLKACSTLLAFRETEQIHAQMIKLRYGSDVYAANSLIHVYAKCGKIKFAQIVFDGLSEPDMVTYNSIIGGYAKSGDLEMAYRTFTNMPSKNIVSWTTMISGYIGAGMSKEALNIFHQMQIEKVKPDKIVLASILTACSNLGALDQGKWIHEFIDRSKIRVDSFLECALIDMYAKCGDMEKALEIFQKMEKKDVVAWTSIISGFSIHGRARDAIEWFSQMQKVGVKPNLVTFTAILTACSHAGLVNEGKLLFKEISSVHNLKPTIEHYGCMVDLLGRAGLLDEAIEFIKTMPVKPNDVIWGAILNSCRIHKNIELGKHIGKMLLEEKPNHGGRYIQLASFHAAAGEWAHAVKTRMQMKKHEITKLPGCSMININGTTYEFFAGECPELEMGEIYEKWDEVAVRLKKNGYKPATNSLLLDLDDEDKETAIYKHSEKLAVSFSLIKTSPGSTIRIIKNLRVCEDCHTVMKLISNIYDRHIIMRDRTRFHHFIDGNCSCGEYW